MSETPTKVPTGRDENALNRGVAAKLNGFHWRDGWYFRRLADGAVELARHEPHFARPRVRIEIPPAEWASIVCSVSMEGENSERWNLAQNFHGRIASQG